MAPKSGDGDVTVALNALHADSRKWGAAAGQVRGAQSSAGNIHLDAAQFSCFGDQAHLTQTYANLQQKVAALLGQAAANFHGISTTLVQVATTYQQNEQKITNSLNSIHN
ncbi:MAG TPA: hypothetical protein VHV49_13465 [Pseudonocardiaceae bacterium]|nr:hypothetical protein [Pseudonocardiaceae bacterium]